MSARSPFIHEISTTTGTGNMTLSAVRRRGSDAFGTGDNGADNPVMYIHNRDVPTEYEVVPCYWSDADTMVRGTPIESSNSNAAVDFSAGTKDIANDPAPSFFTSRELLTANRTYYVRTDGSDSNTGLVDSAGGAFLTIQKAIDVTAALDLSIYAVTIQIGNGTWTQALTLKSYLGVGPVTLRGDPTTPSNVMLSVTSNSAITADAVRGGYVLTGLKLSTTTSGQAILATRGSQIEASAIDFGACAGNHIFCNRYASVRFTGNYTISGSAPAHFNISANAELFCQSLIITLSGTPAFSNTFITINTQGFAQVNGLTFSGSATGKRFVVATAGVVVTGGGGSSYFPGNVAGTTDGATFGLYT